MSLRKIQNPSIERPEKKVFFLNFPFILGRIAFILTLILAFFPALKSDAQPVTDSTQTPSKVKVDLSGEGTEYLSKPPAAKPFNGMLPQKGVLSSHGRGLLTVNSKSLKTVHKVNFDTREVEIIQYLQVGNAPAKDSADASVGNELWSNYYTELQDYSMDLNELSLRRAWLNQFIGKQDAAAGGAAGSIFDLELPVKVPDWLRRFGADKPRLQINGSYKLAVKGYSNWGTGLQGGNWIPNFNMEQQPAFSVKGSIGRLISVSINSEEDFGTNLQDQLKITYKGEGDELEDDIIQEIEAGNTSLSLPATALTGYSENHKGIFGIKGRFKFGGLEVTTIASQEGGTQEEQSLSSTSSDKKYLKDVREVDLYRHFFLTLADRKAFLANRKRIPSSDPAWVSKGEKPDLIVYERSNEVGNRDDTLTAYALNENGSLSTVAEKARWKPLDGKIYIYNPALRLLSITTGSRSSSFAVRWKNDPIQLANDRDRVSKPEKLILIQSSRYLNTPDLTALMARHIYNIGVVPDAEVANFRLKLLDDKGSERYIDSITYTQRLGLNKDKSQDLELHEKDIFDFKNGFLILPCVTNADTADSNCLEPLKRINPKINLYSQSLEEVQNTVTNYKFELIGKERKSTFEVRDNTRSVSGQCSDISPGTEKVTMGPITLVRDLDYQVFYETGTITMLSQRALDPNREIQVKYECTPAFQIQDKVLLGTRFDYKLEGISDESLLGATILYKSQTTTSSIPEIGSEPFNQFLWGANVKLAGKPEWMTKVVNLFPFIETETKSNVNLELEMAQSAYDPNTKGKAYVDNFEQSAESYALPLIRTFWNQASPPLFDANAKKDDNLDYRHMGEFIWHSNVNLPYWHIYGNTGNSYTDSREQSILTLIFRPNDNLQGTSWGGIMRGFNTELASQSKKRFLEVVLQGREGVLNFDLGKMSEDISIAGYSPNGKLDAEVFDGEANKEDPGLDKKTETTNETGLVWECKPLCYSTLISSNFGDPARDNYDSSQAGNGISEPKRSINGTQNNNAKTLGREFDTEDLDRNGILNTETSFIRYTVKLDDPCQKPLCEEVGSYGFRKYQIPLRDAPYAQVIDPAQGSTITADKILANTNYMRIWMGKLSERSSQAITQIARVNLVGNRWEGNARQTDWDGNFTFGSGDVPGWELPSKNPDSSRLQVEVISKQEDKTYSPSSNVQIEKDPRTDEPQIEHSLVLRYNGLNTTPDRQGKLQEVSATRSFSTDKKDLTTYDRLELDVYPKLDALSTGQNKINFALRLGKAASNTTANDYYEIRLPMDLSASDQNQRWLRNSISVPMIDLSSLKNDSNWTTAFGTEKRAMKYFPIRDGKDSMLLSVVGSPSLSEISWMSLVVMVDSNATERQSGEIWINDMRVTGVNRISGTGIRANLSLDFADLLTLSGNTNFSDGDFLSMSEQKKTPAKSSTTLNYGTALSLYANKVFPDAWGVKTPFYLSYKEAIVRPFTKPFSDFRLQGTGMKNFVDDFWDHRDFQTPASDTIMDRRERLSRVYQSTVENVSFSTKYQKDHRTSNFIIEAMLERPEITYGFDQQTENTTTVWTQSRNYNSMLSYNMSPYSGAPSAHPFGWASRWKWMPQSLTELSLNYYPEKLNWTLSGLTFTRSETFNKPSEEDPSIPRQVPAKYTVELKQGMDMEWRPFNFFNFGLRVESSRNFDEEHQYFAGEKVSSLTLPNYPFAQVLSLDDEAGNLGEEYLILLKERNRTQNFHLDFNPDLIPFLQTGFVFTSQYQHNRIESTQGRIEHFEASPDHDLRYTTSLRVPTLFGNLKDWTDYKGSKFLSDGFGSTQKVLDDWKLRNIDLNYNVGHKYNSERYSYQGLKNKNFNTFDFLLYQLGLVYDLRGNWYEQFILGNNFENATHDPTPFDYLDNGDLSAGGTSFSHSVTRSMDMNSGFTIPIPWSELGLSGSLKYSQSYDFTRAWSASDTTTVWPEINVTATWGDWAPKIPFFKKHLRSLNVSHGVTWKKEEGMSPFNPASDKVSRSLKINPLARFSFTTTNDYRWEVSSNWGKDQSDAFDKVSDSIGYQRTSNGLVPYPKYARDNSKRTRTNSSTIGGDANVSWDVETQKGIQFWRWYTKLENNLHLKMSSGSAWNEENKEINEDSPIVIKKTLTGNGRFEVSYNFTSHVDGLFYTAYKYEKTYHTSPEETTHDLEIKGEMTMKF